MTAAAFDRRQYVLLLGLLRTLGSRRELTSQFAMHGPALGILAGFGLLMGGLLALVILGGDIPARDVIMICQVMTGIALVPLLVSEAADALLNPAEASVLSHRPVGNLTYLAAKVTYLLGFSLAIAWAFNLPPALAGIRLAGTAWFYPLTHLAAVTIGATFTALATCGVFGVVFRIVPVARVRTAALWVQLLGGLALPLVPHMSRLLDMRPDFDAAYWSATPMAWFAALGLAGQPGGQPLVMTMALPAMAVAGALVVAGFRALSQGYMTRVSTVLRSKRPPARRPGRGRLARPLVWMTGSRAGFGSTLFVLKLAMRDWQFRRAAFRAAIPTLMLALIAMGRGVVRSPFADDAGFTPVHVLPHLIGISCIVAVDFLPFSDHHKARWIFLTAPASALRGVVRGTMAAIWLMGALIPSVLVLAAGTVLWNVVDAGLFAGFCLAVLSVYATLFAPLQTGLPFTRTPDPTRAAGNLSIMLGCLVVAALLGGIQAFWIFPHPLRVIAGAAVLLVAAWTIGRVSVRVLENRVPGYLDGFTESRTRMFAGLEPDH